MASKMIIERYLWLHTRVKAGKYPNARSLAERFEVSHKTAQRDIEFMRDRMASPLVYVPERRGYRYEDTSYELPTSWLGEDQLTSLIVAYRLAATIPDSSLKRSFRSFLDHVLALHSVTGKISIDALCEMVSVKNIEYSRTDGRTFHRVLDHLLTGRPMLIEYYSPHTDEATTRDIVPLHLLHYMGTWHLIAHCALRGGLRYFTLSRIADIRPSGLDLKPPVPSSSIRDYIRRNFGILNSDDTIEVCLRFSPKIAPWVAEQVWHPRQVSRREPDGTLCLSLPVADFREIKREILRYGSQVEVVSPIALRDEVMGEIAKMGLLYGR